MDGSSQCAAQYRVVGCNERKIEVRGTARSRHNTTFAVPHRKGVSWWTATVGVARQYGTYPFVADFKLPFRSSPIPDIQPTRRTYALFLKRLSSSSHLHNLGRTITSLIY